MEENTEIIEEVSAEDLQSTEENNPSDMSETVVETETEVIETDNADDEPTSEYDNTIADDVEEQIAFLNLNEYADSEWRQSRDGYYRTHYHDIYVQRSEYGWDNMAYYKDCSPYEDKWQFLYDYDIGDYETNEDGSWTLTEHKYEEVAVYSVCYDQYGNAAFYDEFGELHIIDDWENIVFSNSPEGWEPWYEPEEPEPEEPWEPEPDYPSGYTEVPFMEKPLDDYSVTEGVLALTFVLLVVAFIYHILED